jgi:hypothetical protein
MTREERVLLSCVESKLLDWQEDFPNVVEAARDMVTFVLEFPAELERAVQATRGTEAS